MIKQNEITTKKYYAASSYMGLNYTWDSPCWGFWSFDTAADRDAGGIYRLCP